MGSQDFNLTPNPLLFPTIIKEISNYLTPSGLKSYRFVCKQWDEELSKVLKKITHIPLSSESRLEELLNASITDVNFCSNFYLSPDIHLNFQEGEEESITQRFFKKYGSSLKSLYLNNCKWSRNDLKRILYKSCPNLEEFSIVGSGVEEGLFPSNNTTEQEINDEDPTGQHLVPVQNIKCLRVNLICTRMIRNTKLMADLLKITPNLETISWIKTSHDEIRYDRNFQLDLERAWCASPHENGITIRDSVCDIAIHQKSIRLNKLSRIESNMRLSNESIQVLQGRQFPLKYLDISLTIDVGQGVLSSLLTSLSGSLDTLKLEFYPSEVGNNVSNFFDFVFPKMPKLEHLFVQKFSKNFSFDRNFSKLCFPSLKSLTLCETDLKALIGNDQFVGFNNSELNNENVRIFQVICDQSKYSLSDTDISRLAKYFPNLRDIRFENCDEISKSIWKGCFKNLIHLGPPSEARLGGLSLPKSEKECSKCCKHFMKPSSCS